MKIFLLFIAALFFCNLSIAQPKINTILGYTMDPDGTGNKTSISLLGAMENSIVDFQLSYESGNPISTVIFLMTDTDPSNNTKITLTGATVYGLKQYTSTYTNGLFNISSTGNINTEVKFKFQKIEIRKGSSNINTKGLGGNPILDPKTTQSWEIHTDAGIKGVGGEITMQVPKELNFHTHIKFFEAGDTKKIVASWFGNNSAKLLPGLYDAVVDDKYTIKNVPVELGKQTRLKMGVFKVTGYGTVEIENSTTHQKFSAGGPFTKVLPEGTYYINGNKKVPVVIKDGVLTQL